MADEPLLRRANTVKQRDQATPLLLRRITSAYLVPGSPRIISNFKLHTDDETMITLDNVTTPHSVSTPITKFINHGINFHRSSSAPAIYTEEKGLVQRDFLISRRRTLTNPQIKGVALLGLALYIIVGITVFTIASENFKGVKTHKLIDAIYFTIVTLSTIGYGDIVPETTFTKLFTCLFILIGFGFIGTLLNVLVTYVLDRQEVVLLGAVDQNEFIKMIKRYVFGKKKGMIRIRIRMKMGMALGVVFVSLVLGTFTARYIEKLPWVDSFYLSVTSVTTVGYGDHAFKTPAGRCFAIVWLLTSTFAVARAFLYLVEYRIEKRNQRMAKLVLQKKLTCGDLAAADLDRDGSISKAEYVVYKLREMGKIEENDIKEICEQFDTTESPAHTKITIGDLMAGEKSNR